MKSTWSVLLALGVMIGRSYAGSGAAPADGSQKTLSLAAAPPESTGSSPAPALHTITLTNVGIPIAKSTAGPLLKDNRAKASYAIGLQVGGQLRDQNDIEVDAEALGAGVRDALLRVDPALTEKEREVALRSFIEESKAAMKSKNQEAAVKNTKEGEAFLAENKKRKGVVTLPSGLQYEIIKDATGPKPKPTDRVEAHYRGTLIDGTEFDSSFSHGRPAVFPLNRVIKGWTEGVPLMSVGAVYKFFVPSEMAYGPTPKGRIIGPNAVLIFEITLLKIM